MNHLHTYSSDVFRPRYLAKSTQLSEIKRPERLTNKHASLICDVVEVNEMDVYEGWSSRIYLRDATVEVKLIWDESMKVCSFMDMLLSSCSKRNKGRLVRTMLSHGIYPMRSACVCSNMHEFNVVWVNEREREKRSLPRMERWYWTRKLLKICRTMSRQKISVDPNYPTYFG